MPHDLKRTHARAFLGSSNVWLSGVRLVLPDRVLPNASLRFDSGQIAEVIDGPAPHADLHGTGLTAIPGLVDLHGDMLERELEPRPGAAFPIEVSLIELDKRLAAAGVTTAYAAISFSEGRAKHIRSEERAREIIEGVAGLRESLLTDVRIHARFEITNHRAAPILKDLLAAGMVDLVSLNDHTPGQGQYRNLEQFINYVSSWQNKSREEVEQNVQERMRRSQDAPPSWEVIAEITQLARQAGMMVASHDDDSEDKVRLVHGVGATLSEFPVALEAARAAKTHGMQIIMGAPNALRGASHSGNLSALEALEHGLLDILASDYYPAAMLRAALSIAQKGLLDLPAAINLVSLNPAAAVGLNDRGRLEVGQRADLVLLDHQHDHRVVATLRGGKIIYWAGHPLLPTSVRALEYA
jgi:alpha-D-ribose 1-methylphosphonate 5-triphosphate diphosphatase